MAMHRLVPRTVLPRCGLEVSRIGLGLSRLHRLASTKDQRQLIDRALRLGVNHFDTAPLYGDGVGERTLGSVIRPERAAVTIATKFGLLPNRLIGRLGVCGWPLRLARSALMRAGVIRWPTRSFAAGKLRASVHDSLKALQTDYIDILFLHEPLESELADGEELFVEMARLKTEGVIRYTGVSGPVLPSILEKFSEAIDVIQTHESDWGGTSVLPDATFGALGYLRDLNDASKGAAWSLQQALARRAQGMVLVGTTNKEHLEDLAVAVCQTSGN